MRMLFIFLEFFTYFLIASMLWHFFKSLIKDKEAAQNWKKWIKAPHLNKEINESIIIEDLNFLLSICKNRTNKQVMFSLNNIKACFDSLLHDNSRNLTYLKAHNPEEYNDVLKIIYQYIPESLEKYFSIPEKSRNQIYKDGKNANDFISSTFESFDDKISTIYNNLISEKLKDLKVYDSFVHKKFD